MVNYHKQYSKDKFNKILSIIDFFRLRANKKIAKNGVIDIINKILTFLITKMFFKNFYNKCMVLLYFCTVSTQLIVLFINWLIFQRKVKKMIAPENRPKTHYLVKFAGQKQTNYICPGNFQKNSFFS